MAGRIVFDHVWKRFHRGPAHDSLRDLIPALAKRVIGRGPKDEDLHDGDFWAVRDASFEVRPGQALGIIGGNGAGKSTTLKLLTKILGPTRGTALVEGRVGSLVEVSAGFHPDLSGRENVFLQGAIMGMPQKLIRQRFDQIVDFSGISAFIDTPVKRYSSGMNARLGFSIAVHLEPEVLIIDEVLSVGDAEFQGRAFARIRGMVSEDIPVVLVSHQLDRVVELCTHCILLRQGQVAFEGAPASAVKEYLRPNAAGHVGEVPGNSFRFVRVEQLDTGELLSGGPSEWRLEVQVPTADAALHCLPLVEVTEVATGRSLTQLDLRAIGIPLNRPGLHEVSLTLEANLPPGLYSLETKMWDEVLQVTRNEGASVLFSVSAGVPCHGSHQLSPTARVLRVRT